MIIRSTSLENDSVRIVFRDDIRPVRWAQSVGDQVVWPFDRGNSDVVNEDDFSTTVQAPAPESCMDVEIQQIVGLLGQWCDRLYVGGTLQGAFYDRRGRNARAEQAHWRLVGALRYLSDVFWTSMLDRGIHDYDRKIRIEPTGGSMWKEDSEAFRMEQEQAAADAAEWQRKRDEETRHVKKYWYANHYHGPEGGAGLRHIPPNPYYTSGSDLVAARIARGWTRAHMAEILHVSVDDLIRMENMVDVPGKGHIASMIERYYPLQPDAGALG